MHPVARPSVLARASRFRSVAVPRDTFARGEMLTLVATGIAAAVAVALVTPGVRLPGSAILRAGIPLMVGIAIVPRAGAGSIASFGAAIGCVGLAAAGIGRWQPASVVGLLALGPAIDIVVSRRAPEGIPLYGRLAMAGLAANGLAFAVRIMAAWAGADAAGPQPALAFGPLSLVSFLACGAAAGLLGAVVAFRARPAREESSE